MSKVKVIAKQLGIFIVMLAAAKVAIKLLAQGADSVKPGAGSMLSSWF